MIRTWWSWVKARMAAEAAVTTRRRSGKASADSQSLPVAAAADALPSFYFVAIGVVTLAGFLLRLPSFNSSLASNETSTFYIVNGHSLGRVLSLLYSGQESTPPLYFVLAWLTKGWFGAGHMAQGIRLVPLAAGTAAIPLTFVLGLQTVGRRAALVGATCVACSPFMIFYSTEARTYMLVLFLGLASSICLLRALDTNRLAWWAGYAVSSCAAVYSHYSVVFFLVAQVAWAFFAAPRARKPLVWSNVAAVAGFLPAVGGLPADFKAPNLIALLVPVNLTDIRDILERFWIGHPEMNVASLPGNVAVLLGAAGLALGALGSVSVLRKRARPWWRVSRRTLLLVVLAVAPTLLMIAYSVLRVDVLGGGNIIASWPAMALGIGLLVTVPRTPLRIVAVALVIGAYAIGGVKMLSNGSQNGDVHDAVAYIERTGDNGDPIVSAPMFANPLSEVDAALAGTPSYTYVPGDTLDRARSQLSGDPHPVIRLAALPAQAPPLDEQFQHLAGPRPQPVFLGLPAPSGQDVAQQAISEAPHGTVFVVTPYPISFKLRLTYASKSSSNPLFNSLNEFLVTMSRQHYHVVKQKSFASFTLSPGGEYVTVFRKDG
jgi:hypothetical protein